MLANISPTFDRSARLFRQQFLFLYYGSFCPMFQRQLIISAQTFQVNHLQVVFVIWPTSSVTPGI